MPFHRPNTPSSRQGNRANPPTPIKTHRQTKYAKSGPVRVPTTTTIPWTTEIFTPSTAQSESFDGFPVSPESARDAQYGPPGDTPHPFRRRAVPSTPASTPVMPATGNHDDEGWQSIDGVISSPPMWSPRSPQWLSRGSITGTRFGSTAFDVTGGEPSRTVPI
ncbi:hypothetical protein CcaCcLH18_04575 [Colletotrichum camelliae]|nr:hypothetical protein CcaCcLH18_04575 [Colletotrichum camelliae]